MDKSIWKKYGYLILLLYLLVGIVFFPVLGSIALICMLAPVVMAFYRGREWCGKYCPRGSLWDSIFSPINKNKEIPAWARSKQFRVMMLLLIFTVFGVQMFFAWPDPAAIGMVFLRIILITTAVGMVLALLYSPRTWCNFCPMGTLASWVSEGKKTIYVDETCVKCGLCSRVCPMQHAPYLAPDKKFTHVDCLKCDACIEACPKKALSYTKGAVCDAQKCDAKGCSPAPKNN